MRRDVLTPEDGGGLAVVRKGDGPFTRTSSDAVRCETDNLAASNADVWLLRLGIEGSRRYNALGTRDEGAVVAPSFELGGGSRQRGRAPRGSRSATTRHGASPPTTMRSLSTG